NVDIRHLQSFLAVAEERHFGRAADRLHLAQPSLTQRIQQLEQDLGVALLERTTRRVELTPAGELFLTRAAVLVGEFDALVDDVREVGSGASGILRLGCVGTAAYWLLPKIVAMAGVELPGLHLQVQSEMLTPQIERSFSERRFDVALLRPPVHSAELAVRPLLRERLVIATAPGSDLATRLTNSATIPLTELADEDLIGYPRGSVVDTIATQHAQRLGVRTRIVHRMAETSTVLSFVAAGLGSAIVPESARSAAHVGLLFFSLDDSPTLDLSLVWRQDDDSRLLASFLRLAMRFRGPDLIDASQEVPA
ncbi:LysR family transcriptional regulator, partial [Microbacterium sp.]|uniref:LysR family transcriptional regulator n=1 Tax=Microbacterium sp. TaxID=51671 RepID=UPI003F9D5E51